MPELPDLELYRHALTHRLQGQVLTRVRVGSPFLLRTWEPSLSAVEGRLIAGFERLGKRLVWVLADDLFLVLHLMLAGRLKWSARPPAKVGGKVLLAVFETAAGAVSLLEAGSRKRAALHVVAGRDALAEHDPGGLEPLDLDLPAFAARLRSENHTLKRSLTDPRLFAGIGNAYSDEILWHAQLSPLQTTARLDEVQVARLHTAVQSVLQEATARLQRELGDGFPEPAAVTAFRPEFATHGKFGQPCPRCAGLIERIRYADTETNYCPRCQTGGRPLADRGLSTLLKQDWPRTAEELEALRRGEL
ncbi:MAG: hypothetical protein IT204_13005 [Fimbriimonadaceae bacterium]|nr:hypothetical protein [Fimbriimonadaceae bacterium]